MARDSQDTRRRILEAATAEFAERGIAGARGDRYCTHPEVVRLALWDRLERDGQGMRVAGIVAAETAKAEALARAQDGGAVSALLSPADLLAAITLVTSLWPLMQAHDDSPSRARLAEMRTAVTAIVSRLTEPGPTR